MKKYELTSNFIINNMDIKLYQIKSLVDFGTIVINTLGGYIAKEKNLAQEGECWVYDNAQVWGKAQITGDALVYDNAKVYGNAILKDNARVGGTATVFENAIIKDTAHVYGDAYILGNTEVSGEANVSMKCDFLKIILAEPYFVTIQDNIVQIGCWRRTKEFLLAKSELMGKILPKDKVQEYIGYINLAKDKKEED